MNAPTAIDLKEMLGQQLIEKGLVTIDQLDIALTEQKKNDRLLGEVLVGLGFVSESIMRDVLSQVLGIASVDLSKVIPDMVALDLIEKEIAERYIIVPVSFDDEEQRLKIAMKNVSDLMVLDRVHALVGRKIELEPMVAGEGEIKKAIDQFYGYE
ncbi:MAG: secretion system protein E, partial [Gammaproteobacteria bacterium]|nr:secretion system protein E [Gammaproteobacteria bacterium]